MMPTRVMSDIRLVYGLRTLFSDLFSNPAYQPYDLSIDQVLLAEETRVNRDPFDALICAAARDLELPLITRDNEIRRRGRSGSSGEHAGGSDRLHRQRDSVATP